ncbi:hypothetical protein E2P60_04565 [Candidatus Bathyarchaeota archaeon]|nr:hypothetical protein E2P60_04565 [Candidatus Bathyarchaeota archaeon]
MASIQRSFSTSLNSEFWKVLIRRKGLPTFCLNFNTKEEAENWAKENEFEYIKNPKKYLLMDRLELKRERERKRKNLK